jgi:hypothetical protein
LNKYRSNDRCGRPVASTGRHLEKPLLQRKLAYLSHAAVSASKKRGHDPRYKLKEGKERAVEVLEEFGGLKDAINRAQDALTQDGRTKSRIVMMVFVRDGDRREDWNCHGRLKSRSAIEMLLGVLSGPMLAMMADSQLPLPLSPSLYPARKRDAIARLDAQPTSTNAARAHGDQHQLRSRLVYENNHPAFCMIARNIQLRCFSSANITSLNDISLATLRTKS